MTELIKKYKPSVQLPLFILLGLWLVYATLSIIAPANQVIAKYGISITQGNMLRVTVVLPMLIIWLASFFAVARFRQYTALVKNTADGMGFSNITTGLLLLFLTLLIPSFINVIGSFYPGSEQVQKIVVILRNYIQLFLYFGAFWFLLKGARYLNATLPPVVQSTRSWVNKIVAVKMIVLTSVYVWAVFHNDFRTSTVDPLIRPTYYLPDWLIVLTIIIPYLLVWLMGSLAVGELWLYATRVRGNIYRKSFTWVLRGLSVLIGLTITLQLLTQAASALSAASLKVILFILYLVLLVISIAYLFLAKGAKELAAIEEV